MKKIIAMLLISGFICTVLTGCATNPAPQKNQPPQYQVIGEMKNDSLLREEPTLEVLCAHASVIADVKIQDISYTYTKRIPRMDVTFSVTESYRGEYQAEEMFHAYLPGGYVSVAEYTAERGMDYFPDIPEEKRSSSYLYFPMNYDKFPEIGDELLVFLSEGQESFPEGLYTAYGYADSVCTFTDGMYRTNSSAPDFSREQLMEEVKKS